ncbi:MAG: ABC transporter permease [Eubacteriales bacterium]
MNDMILYILKRILLMLLTFVIIFTICFVLIKALDNSREDAMYADQAAVEEARREALGYNKPILEQLRIYAKNIITKWDWGTSWKIDRLSTVNDVIFSRLLPTVLVNTYSLIFSVPIGILIGIYSALKKNKWQDYTLSTLTMVFYSVPSYVYAFIVQYFIAYKLGLLPIIQASLREAGGSYFTWIMFRSQILPVLALSFGSIAGLTRFTRAELTETLTSDYMLLARTKGLSKSQATRRHALRNAMVPILPAIIGSFVGVLGGSIIIEQIFAIPGIGPIYVKAISLLDYDVFMAVGMFYTFIGLAASILIDLSYGFIDPRIRMGAKKQ